jgi:pyruvate formate-lyase/glycerol dehydratase family glycyl radical enzyme
VIIVMGASTTMMEGVDDPALSVCLQTLKRRVSEQARAGLAEQRFGKRREVYAVVWREHGDDPPVVRTARALAQFLAEKELFLSPEDLLAGGEQFYDFTLPQETARREDPAPPFEAPLSEAPLSEAGVLETFRRGQRVGLYCGGLGGHVIAGYDRVLRLGLGACIRAAEAAASAEAAQRPGAGGDFAVASLMVCRAASDYARRYASRARELAAQAHDPEIRARMERVAAACDWVALEPPRTFFEALQLLWLTHEIITAEQSSGSLSLGRLDQVLYPYYRRDVDGGCLAPQEAAQLIEALWCKFAGLRRGFQNVTLSGSDGQGHDLTNELSFLCLRATRKLRMDQPLISVRWHPRIDPAFWQEVEALVQQGMGFPALFNEQVVVAAKEALGVSPQDAWDWGVVGCVEPSVPGKEFSHTEGLRVNWAKVLEAMLNDGCDAVSGEPVPLQEPRDLATVATFDQFYAWYRRELVHAVDLGIRGMNLLDATFSQRTPYPFLSSTMEGPIMKGRDVTEGSTVYNLCTVNGLAMANVADALVAIKKVVFEDRLVSLSELAEALRKDFAGGETLRQALLRCPKYGNDQEEPDHLLRELSDDFVREIHSRRNGRGGRMQCGLYTVDSHGFMGQRTGALPDGRRRGVALANALSPAQGADTSGPTAVIRSCTKLNHAQLGNGMVLDIKFAPGFFAEMRRQGIFGPLVETYFRSGGMEIQFNVIDRATLLAAQRSPHAYRDLVVRVSGFSAYFVDLDQVVQNEIIARTEHATL